MVTSFRVGFLLIITSFLLIAFSLTANFLAISMNDWRIPVESELVSWEIDDGVHKEMNKETNLKYLCDIFPVRSTSGQVLAVQSIGDKARTASIPILLVSVIFFILPWLYQGTASKT